MEDNMGCTSVYRFEVSSQLMMHLAVILERGSRAVRAQQSLAQYTMPRIRRTHALISLHLHIRIYVYV